MNFSFFLIPIVKPRTVRATPSSVPGPTGKLFDSLARGMAQKVTVYSDQCFGFFQLLTQSLNYHFFQVYRENMRDFENNQKN